MDCGIGLFEGSRLFHIGINNWNFGESFHVVVVVFSFCKPTPPPLLFFGGAEGEGGRLGEITEFGVLFCRS